MVIFVLLDTGVCLLQTTTSSGAKVAVFIFPQQSPIYGWALASTVLPYYLFTTYRGYTEHLNRWMRL
jgi:hypothetical protein